MLKKFVKQKFIYPHKYKNATINSPNINPSFKIGKNSVISENVTISKNVVLGKYSYINKNTIVGDNTNIGNYCSISYNCIIGLNNHPINLISTSPNLYSKNNPFSKDILWEENELNTDISNDVWIGANVVIKKGISIGNGAVVGAGSVVTKDVEPFSIVGGVPAKHIKYRFETEQRNYLQGIKWWEKDIDDLKQYKELFLKNENWIYNISAKNETKK